MSNYRCGIKAQVLCALLSLICEVVVFRSLWEEKKREDEAQTYREKELVGWLRLHCLLWLSTNKKHSLLMFLDMEGSKLNIYLQKSSFGTVK